MMHSASSLPPVLLLSNVMGDIRERLLPAPLGWPTSEAFSPKTVLEKTVCRRVQHS